MIDVGTRLEWGGERGSLAEAAARYASALRCVSGSMVMGRVGCGVSWEADERALLGVGGGALVFAGIDLRAVDAVDRVGMAAEGGAVGIRISPGSQGVRPTDDRCWRVVEAAAGAGLVVGVMEGSMRGGSASLAYADVGLFDEHARSVGGLRLLVVELGRFGVEGSLGLLESHGNVVASTSWLAGRSLSMWQVLTLAYERSVLDRVVFGSGYPRCLPERVIGEMYSLGSSSSRLGVPRPTCEAIRGVIESDALEMLGIEGDALGSRGGGVRDVVGRRGGRRGEVVRRWN